MSSRQSRILCEGSYQPHSISTWRRDAFRLPQIHQTKSHLPSALENPEESATCRPIVTRPLATLSQTPGRLFPLAKSDWRLPTAEAVSSNGSDYSLAWDDSGKYLSAVLDSDQVHIWNVDFADLYRIGKHGLKRLDPRIEAERANPAWDPANAAAWEKILQ